MTNIMANLRAASSHEVPRAQAFNTTSMKAPYHFLGLNHLNSEVLFSPNNLSFIMIRKISLKTRIKFSMPLHFAFTGIENRLSLIFPISPIQNQHTSSITMSKLASPDSRFCICKSAWTHPRMSWDPACELV
ncbi:hypothetical protein O181_035622 [Austropuccinia psidii MF-1]|uniref:Uncharacterized protein n=1 Tax=Austropuccinia psidii MF-1 TaxID=1389203 RepID=A0A9Q3D5J7_9BASI|nr:hypothetical protein [Austropuccinia psidii MF-1]